MFEEILVKKIVKTPYGEMVALSSVSGLCVLEFLTPNRTELLKNRLNKWFPFFKIVEGSNNFLVLTEKWLSNYFAGRFDLLERLDLDLRGTEFEMNVWQELQKISYGMTLSYIQLAKQIGNPNGSRAVGGANRRNPISIIVPCHRVIGSNGSLVGYGGGLDLKELLITHERISLSKLHF